MQSLTEHAHIRRRRRSRGPAGPGTPVRPDSAAPAAAACPIGTVPALRPGTDSLGSP
ncbi:hypothetical protein GCM10018793_16500 [Streptomyces sulfonofaciens]|uniref:Uncharacterized protein n=1 Tax=Streptomyces sulfonofaciens TaxID=68272 RepID=A0A919FYE1_9ACTN|nr:hypothetical protein GCM10018793_16500 [Streptomyces sulfonofaciens]